MHDLDFTVRRVDAFHIRVDDMNYWEGYRGDDTLGGRYVFKPGWRTVYTSSVETPLVRVELADGTVGWGEATAPICPEVVALVVSNLITPLVQGREFENPTACWDFLYDANRCRGHQSGYFLEGIAAVDVAIWDALSRRAGLPLARLLADDALDAVPVYLSGIRRGTREDRRELLGQWTDRGLRGVKLFTDDKTEETLEELDWIHTDAPDLDLMVDALWTYQTVEAAQQARDSFSNYDVAWLECPMIPEDLVMYRDLQQGSGTPIALGEAIFTRFQLEPWIAKPAALNIFQPDICRTGFSDGIRQMKMAAACGIPTTPHMGTGTPIVQAAALSFASAFTRNVLCEYQAGIAEKFPSAINTDWHFVDGDCVTPQTPGLGINVDPDALMKFAVRQSS